VDDLKGRTRRYALRIIKLYEALPSRGAGQVLAHQVLRSGTSVGAHYREAVRSRSRAEYIAKLNGGLMELEETLYWLELVEESNQVKAEKLAPLKNETDQLIRILVRLIKNWKR
jgi:four helix bundle protein